MTLDAQLGTLERAELIRLAQAMPETEYLFRHALVQEAAYQSLLKATRRALHQAIGMLLESEYADRLDEFAPVLAHHFFAGEDLPRATQYYLRAGEHATRQFANAEALEHFDSALSLVRHARGTHPGMVDTLALGKRAHLARGRLLEITGRYVEALAGYHELEQWALAAGDIAAEQAALMAQATLYNTPTPVHNAPQGKALMLRILPLARAAGDRAAETRILWSLMLSVVYSGGEMQEAQTYCEAGLSIAAEAGLTELRALILHDSLFVQLALHGPAAADAALAEAVRLWRQLDNPPLLAETLIFRSMVAVMTGQYDASATLVAEAKQVARAAKHTMSLAYADIMTGRVLEDRGMPGQAIRTMEDAIRLADETQSVGTRIFARLDLGLAYGRLGAIERGEAILREAGQVMREIVPFVASFADSVLARLRVLAGDAAGARERQAVVLAEGSSIEAIRRRFTTFPPGVGDILLAEAETRLAEGDAEGALAWLEDGVAVLGFMQMRMAQCEAALLRARALRAVGRREEIGAALDEAQTIAEAVGSRRTLWQILAERARSEDADAPALRGQARAIVAQIAADVDDDSLRRSYLAGALAVIGA